VWQIDLYGPLPMLQRAQLYILSTIDMLSKFVYNVPLSNCDGMTVSQAMFDLFCQFGVCSTIISDKGSEFLACPKAMMDHAWCKILPDLK
jgi:hypothetical protein